MGIYLFCIPINKHSEINASGYLIKPVYPIYSESNHSMLRRSLAFEFTFSRHKLLHSFQGVSGID